MSTPGPLRADGRWLVDAAGRRVLLLVLLVLWPLGVSSRISIKASASGVSSANAAGVGAMICGASFCGATLIVTVATLLQV